MLSMRNGLASHPMYLPGAVHPFQVSQLCMGFGDSTSTINLGVLGMLPCGQDSSANSSLDLTTQRTTSHQTIMLPVASISAPETSFTLQPSQSHHMPFPFRVSSEEMFRQGMGSQHKLDSGRITGTLSENVMKTKDASSSLQFGKQASSSLERSHHLESVLSKDHPDGNATFDQDYERAEIQQKITLQTGSSFAKDDVKPQGAGI